MGEPMPGTHHEGNYIRSAHEEKPRRTRKFPQRADKKNGFGGVEIPTRFCYGD
jgi:hypothetical protein